jgi:molybdopterin-containing oxidoreductase family iron-sulfur binding subunit
MSSLERPSAGKQYWRSLAERADAPEFRRFLEAEFPDAGVPYLSPTEKTGTGSEPKYVGTAGAVTGSVPVPVFDGDDGLSRRRWLQLMGASLALAGLSGCRWEKRELVAEVKRPKGRTPGKPQRLATAMDLAGSAIGLLVTCVDGRPIKIEGNPRHPASLGGTDAFTQAAILELYDPDRSHDVYRAAEGGPIVQTWDKFAEFARPHFAALRKSGGAGFHILAEASSSPTRAILLEQLLEELPDAMWHEYEPAARERGPLRTDFDLEASEVIVCLDADLLGAHPAAVRYAREFAKGREVVEGRMNRLYVVESHFTVTGASADHRLAIRAEQIAGFAEALRRAIEGRAPGVSPGIEEANASHPRADAQGSPDSGGSPDKFLRAMADDLLAHKGQCVVAVGPRQPGHVHETVRAINAALGNMEQTVWRTVDYGPDRLEAPQPIEALIAAANAGHVGTLLILGGNPVYNAPADLPFAEALAKIGTTIHLSRYRDETSRLCTWHLPEAHFLEAWSDARSYPGGEYSIVQPAIAPLNDGRSALEILSLLLEGRWPDAEKLVRKTFETIARIVGGGTSDQAWREILHNGISPASPAALMMPLESELPAVVESKPAGKKEKSGSDLEIVFCADAKVFDGRFANNGWLQELPDPMTRLTWDNAAILSPATAERLGVANGELVRLKYRGGEAQLPAYIMPGQADASVAVMLGYGRTAAGQVGGSSADGVAPVGVDVYRLRHSAAMHFDSGLAVEPTGVKYPLAMTQNHFAIDTVGMEARAQRVGSLIRETTLSEETGTGRGLAEHEAVEKDSSGQSAPHPRQESLWQEPEYKGHRWGMAIELSKCIGCGACVVACQAENNIPVVGKERVLVGREMHWLRIDRYFTGDPADPQIAVQPVACHHCEMAPCEQVCPFGATVHSAEGLNDMVYNRCVGTRYCANNCPYKVRRFNFFNYHKQFRDAANEVLKMAHNPEVTVRSRGVMEKCTYCVQRIQAAKIAAKNEGRPIEDGEIRTACQQACPAGAIVFGDLNDKQSAVLRACHSKRAYGMLAELNVKPRTQYLTRVRNPNPVLLTLRVREEA